MTTFGRIEEYDSKEPWPSHTERLDMFFNANGIEDDEKKNILLPTVGTIARMAEAAELNASELRKGHSTGPASPAQEGSANHLKFKKRHMRPPKGHKAQELNPRGKPKAGHHEKFKPCVRCGSCDHRPLECKHINTWCYQCDKVSHLASCCLSSADKGKSQRGSQVNTVQSADKPPKYYLHSLRTQSFLKPITMTFSVNGVPLEIELDSGSPVSIISKDTYLQHQGALSELLQTDIKLNCIRRTILVQGTLFVDVRLGETASQQSLLVVACKSPSLCGRD
ncbi:hypothetical protein MRX96_027673 [Rhipicephalus microplus]